MAHTFEQIEATAKRAGYTKRVMIEAGHQDLYGFIRPNDDHDGSFLMIEEDNGELLRVNGWNCTIHDID